MLKEEFLKMQRKDLVTKNEKILDALLECFEDILKNYSADVEIDPSKTVEECYKQMEDFARKNAKNCRYCFTPQDTKMFVEKYLNLEQKSSMFVKLEDFF